MNDDAPSPDGSTRDRAKGLRQNLAAALSGVLVLLAFPRYGAALGLDGLIVVALVPLLLVGRGVGWRRGLVLGWWSGVIIEGTGFVWILHAIREFTAIGPALASLAFALWLGYAVLPWMLLGGAVGASRRPADLYIVLLLWIGIEGLIPRLFTWHLGGALYSRPLVIQCVDLLGASGLTAWVFLLNVTALLVILWFRQRVAFPWRTSVAAVAVSAAIVLYGQQRLAELEAFEATRPEQQVLLVQGAIDPRGMQRAEHTRAYRSRLEYYLETTRVALEGRTAGPPVSLIVWPEGADPHHFGITPGLDPWLRAYPSLGHRSEDRDALLALLTSPEGDADPARALIFGGSGGHVQRLGSSNIAVVLAAGREPRFYEKNRLMPLGEWTPFLEGLSQETQRSFASIGLSNRIRGLGNPLLELPDGTGFRQLICYEAVIPDYVRQSAEGADLLVNLTEDMWYGRTSHIPQHVSVLVLRVVENRTPLVRVTNIGPSGVIDIRGRFHHGSAIFQPEVVVGSVRPGAQNTFYQSYGYMFPLMALGASFLLAWVARRRRTGKEVAPEAVQPRS